MRLTLIIWALLFLSAALSFKTLGASATVAGAPGAPAANQSSGSPPVSQANVQSVPYAGAQPSNATQALPPNAQSKTYPQVAQAQPAVQNAAPARANPPSYYPQGATPGQLGTVLSGNPTMDQIMQYYYTRNQQEENLTLSVSEQEALLAKRVSIATPEQRVMIEQKRKLLKKLTEKLINYKGNQISIMVTKPVDHTKEKVGPIVLETILSTLKKYGNLKIDVQEDLVEYLTLEEFRKTMSAHQTDVLIVSVLKNTNFDLYIYDRRTPFYIYAHSEAIPEIAQLNFSNEVAKYHSRTVLRRTLYRYVNEQYFELPRRETAPVLQSEIPRWVASTESLTRVNREMRSRFYGGVTTGAALTYGRTGEFWNSSLIGLNLGFRIGSRLFLEVAGATSAYNVLLTSAKYIFLSRATPFQVGVGLGWSYITSRKVWTVDETLGLGKDSYYAVPSIMLLFPIGDVFLKFEHQSFIGLDLRRFMFTFMPGIMVHF